MEAKLKKFAAAAAALLGALFLCSCGETPAPIETAAPSPVIKLAISELMAANKATLADSDGSFPDWIELHNLGTEELSLEGFILSDGKRDYALPAMTLGGDEYSLIFCRESGGGSQPTVPFSLSKDGETVTLKSPDGQTLDSFRYESAEADISLVRVDGAVREAEYATPGFENSEQGCEDFQSTLHSGSELAINEVMSYNRWFMPAEGQYYDWVELKNVSDYPILLSDFYISDDDDDLLMYRLPKVTLGPGELYTLLCIDDAAALYAGVAAPFAVDSAGDTLYLSDEDGLCDCAVVRELKYGGSYGRMQDCGGFFYFDTPSPGSENSAGARLISHKPSSDTEQGVYDNVYAIKISLSGEGDIYYTLDGSAPDMSSKKYDGPFTLSSTTVVRCICAEDGKLASEPLTLSYIINEEHDLPVVSLAVDPADMYDKNTGIYTHPTQDWERAASVAYFDGEDGFAMDCGVKIHGATSREAQKKKSYKLKFKDRYEGELNYDLFGNGVTVFSDVLLRAAQESTHSSNIRDILMHELAEGCYADMPTQSYKFAVLYINGEYWGIYALREAYSTEYYARHYGYNAENVTMTQGYWDQNSPLNEVYNYILNHDQSDPESFEYISSLADVDSLITWQIIQSYSGNLDMNPPNVRFFWTSGDYYARYALVDLDLGLFNTGDYELSFNSGYQYSSLLRLLLYNGDYRERAIVKLAEYLSGPLSDEKVLDTLHSLEDEIRSEIPRDARRWDYDVGSWERDLGYIEGRLTVNGGMAKRFAASARYYLDIENDLWDKYYSDLE